MSNKKQYFASDRLNDFEKKEKQIRKDLGDDYYEYYHNKYQREADFDGLMMCISIALILMMFCAYMNH